MFEQKFRDHFIAHGLVALMIAVGSLLLARGLNPFIVIVWILPPALAVFWIRSPNTANVRWIATSFLTLIGMGVIVAPIPALFPKLGGVERNLPAWQDRLLTWYVGVYAFYFLSVAPLYAFIRNLRSHRRGEPAVLARPICWLGLVPATLLTAIGPFLLAEMFGFWPAW